MRKQPSLAKIVIIDHTASVACLTPIILWLLYLLCFNKPDIDTTDLSLQVVIAALTIYAIAVLVLRIRLFYTIFSDDMRTTAIISKVSIHRNRTRIDYVYTFQGQEYSSGNDVNDVKRVQALRLGDQVIVMVDRNHPKRAFIRDLYL